MNEIVYLFAAALFGGIAIKLFFDLTKSSSKSSRLDNLEKKVDKLYSKLGIDE